MPAVVSLPLIESAGGLLVPARIRGWYFHVRPEPAVAWSSVSRRVATVLGLPWEQAERWEDMLLLAGGRTRVPIVRAQVELTTTLPARELDLRVIDQADGSGVDGTLGADFWRGRRPTFDLERRRLRVS
ncbi:MAG: hypothetical protein HY329_14245 [Chloroflexi bacterium]|nr:hypothetical protein [Chloroflexota bacterium]